MLMDQRAVAALSELGVYWDDRSPGLGLRITRGSKTWVFKYRTLTGTQRWLKLASFQDMTLAQARARHAQARAAVLNGEDPAEEKKELRRSKTVATVCQMFLEEHAEPRLKPSTVRTYRLLVRDVIVSELGSIPMIDLTPAQVSRMHQAWKANPRYANQALAVLSKICNMAETFWRDGRGKGIRPLNSNPCKGIRRFPETSRERFLDEGELTRLEAILKAEETVSPIWVAAIRLLMFTGARTGEIQSLTWDEVLPERSCLILKEGRAKETKRAKIITLSDEALAVIQAQPRHEDCPWVFPNATMDGPTGALDSTWRRVRTKLGATNLRKHDLRHTLASLAAKDGASIPQIMAMTGHLTPAMAYRYTHLTTPAIKPLMDKAAKRIKKNG